MATSSITQLYSNFIDVFENKPDSIIQFHQKNIILFDNNKSFKNSDEIKLYIDMVCHYTGALYAKSYYTDTVNSAEKYLPIIEEGIKDFNADYLYDDWYYGIVFFKAMAYYNVREFKIATILFKQLQQHDPKNERYQNWLNHSKHRQTMGLIKIINIICLVLIAVDILFINSSMKQKFIDELITALLIIIVVFISIFEYTAKHKFKKTSRDAKL
jgi:hypothetical protein